MHTPMTQTLDYASLYTPRPRLRWPIASLAIALALAGSGSAVDVSADAARAYLGTLSGCASGRSAAVFDLYITTPALFMLPAIGWLLSARVGVGVIVCRAALCGAVAAWSTAWVCAFHGRSLLEIARP